MDMLSQLIHLSYQYGPFAFALIFLIVMARWGQKKYSEACRVPTATEKEKNLFLSYFVGVTVVGVSLVFVSVYWWWTHQPVYWYEGQIDELSETETIEGGSFFVKNEYYPQDKDDPAPRFRDVHFLVVQKEPFAEGQEIKLRYFRDRKLSKPLLLTVRSGERYAYALEYDEQQQRWLLKQRGRKSDPRVTFFRSAYAQPTSERQQVLPRAAPTSPLTLPRPNAPLAISKKSAATPEFELVARELQNPRTLVSSKVELLDKLQSASPVDYAELFSSNASRGEPLFVTLLDLTRHTDREIASKAGRIVAKAPLPVSYFSALLTSKDPNLRNEAMNQFRRLDPRYATTLLAELAKQRVDVAPLKKVLDDGGKWRLVVPTGTATGDRYYVKAEWDKTNSVSVQCVAKAFQKNVATGKDSQQNLEYMKARNIRLAFDSDKSEVLQFAAEVENCGAKATFVGYYPSK